MKTEIHRRSQFITQFHTNHSHQPYSSDFPDFLQQQKGAPQLLLSQDVLVGLAGAVDDQGAA